MESRKPLLLVAELALLVFLFGFITLVLSGKLFPFMNLLTIEVVIIAWVFVFMSVRTRRLAVECSECGRRFLPSRSSAEKRVCRLCEQRSQSPDRLRRERSKNGRTIGIIIGLFASAVTLLLAGSVAQWLGVDFWVAAPLVAFLAVAGFFALIIFMAVIVQLRHQRMLRSPRQALAFAQKIAGATGRVETAGLVTVWSSGDDAPASYFVERLNAVRETFEKRLGEPVGNLPPLRIFVFSRRGAFLAFHRQGHSGFWNVDALYLGGPSPSVAISQEVLPARIADADRTLASVFGFYLIESYKGFFPAPWLYYGVGSSVSARSGDLARLNHKMLVAIQQGATFGAELFRFNSRQLLRLVMGWSDYEKHAKFAIFTGQTASVVEYLWGDDAASGNRECFRSLLRSLTKRESVAVALEHHFGRSADQLLQGWQDWVRARGVGVHEVPPLRIRTAIVNRIVPLVEDPRAKIMDRIQAVRELGRVGYPLGADALIRLLASPGEIPSAEIVWSLEAISGLTLGGDVRSWKEWWDRLPSDVKGTEEAAMVEDYDNELPAEMS